MADQNPYHKAAERLVGRLMEAEEKARKSRVTPFGMEPVSADTEAKAFAAMNREGKARFMAQHATKDDPHGLSYTMKVIERLPKETPARDVLPRASVSGQGVPMSGVQGGSQTSSS